ncbi:MAG: hypothetical protein IJT01_08540 [Selenomonadaceae bacterium]|nr:hypothetical protein [Selenomonadaceae bacterium]
MKNLKKRMFLTMAALAAVTGTAFANATIPIDAHRYNGHFYYVFDNVADSWEEAESYCESRGGYLAVIDDAAENRELYDLMKRSGKVSAYFGLTDAGHKNEWRWVNEAPLRYTNWHTGEPNRLPGEHYAMFLGDHPAYTWNDGDFGRGNSGPSKAFLCEWDSLQGSGVVYTPDGARGPGHRPPEEYGHHRPHGHAHPGNNGNTVTEPSYPPVPKTEGTAPNFTGGKVVTFLHFDGPNGKKEKDVVEWGSYGKADLDTFGAKSGTAMSLRDGGYLTKLSDITIGGQDFTIDFWMNMSSYSGSYARAFALFNTLESNSQALLFYRSGTSGDFYTMWNNSSAKNPSMKLDHLQHVAIVYRHDLGVLTTYVDGIKNSEIKCTVPRTRFSYGYIGKSNFKGDGSMTGTLDEFRIVDGAALWKSDFVPPTSY